MLELVQLLDQTKGTGLLPKSEPVTWAEVAAVSQRVRNHPERKTW